MPKIYAIGDSVTASEYNEVVKTAGLYGASSGGSDTYAITVTPTPGSYAAGDVYHFKADVANTGAATLNVNSLGAKTIKRVDGSDLQTGDILASQFCKVIYDGTNFQLISANLGPVVVGATASNNQQFAADTERSGNATSYTKIKEILVKVGGTIRVLHEMKASGAFGRSYIAVNDAQAGSSRGESDNAYHSYSEDITIKAYDKVSIYYKSDTGPVTTYIKNFRINYDLAPTTSGSVVTD